MILIKVRQTMSPDCVACVEEILDEIPAVVVAQHHSTCPICRAEVRPGQDIAKSFATVDVDGEPNGPVDCATAPHGPAPRWRASSYGHVICVVASLCECADQLERELTAGRAAIAECRQAISQAQNRAIRTPPNPKGIH